MLSFLPSLVYTSNNLPFNHWKFDSYVSQDPKYMCNQLNQQPTKAPNLSNPKSNYERNATHAEDVYAELLYLYFHVHRKCCVVDLLNVMPLFWLFFLGQNCVYIQRHTYESCLKLSPLTCLALRS